VRPALEKEIYGIIIPRSRLVNVIKLVSLRTSAHAGVAISFLRWGFPRQFANWLGMTEFLNLMTLAVWFRGFLYGLFVIVEAVAGLAAVAALIVLFFQQVVAHGLNTGGIVLCLHHQEVTVNAG